MIVVTANWGLGDGSLAAAPAASLPGLLSGELHRAALRSGFRRDGRYRPIESVGLVLAGDTFDGLVSDRWLDGVRPWERRRSATLRHEAVMRSAWRGARRYVGWVIRLARCGLRVPAGDRHGRPVLAASVRVPAHVVVLIGDRDASLARAVTTLRSRRTSIDVGTLWEAKGVRVAHGAACDPLAGGDAEPTLLQSLAVDLIAPFGAALRTRTATAERGRRLVRLLVEAGPLDAPRRLAASLAPLAGEESWVVSAWQRAVDRWAREARRCGCADSPGVVDAVAAWMHHLPGCPAPSSAVRRTIETLGAPLPPGAADGLLVLGHPGPLPTAAEEVVCLGPPSMAACREDSVAATRGRGGPVCVETSVSALPGRLPAAVILEADEGSSTGPRWWPLAEARHATDPRPGGGRILDAA